MDELDRHMMACEFSVTGSDSTESKVNILLQTYISKQIVDNFSLVSDMSYVAQVIKTDYSCTLDTSILASEKLHTFKFIR